MLELGTHFSIDLVRFLDLVCGSALMKGAHELVYSWLAVKIFNASFVVGINIVISKACNLEKHL